jgi:hypothetical protein
VVIDSGRVAADSDTLTILADSATLKSHGLELPI